jgi:hypothetical protein
MDVQALADTPRNREQDLKRLLALFNFDDKRSLSSYARHVTIYQRDFVDLILACKSGRAAPFKHQAYYGEIVPAELEAALPRAAATLRSEHGQFSQPGKKAIRTLGAWFAGSGPIAGHAFYVPGTQWWHLFCFDHSDERRYDSRRHDKRNHFEGGPHVHFVNWLWTLDPGKVWRRLREDHQKPNGSLHIKFDDLFEPYDDPR